jgi:Ca-activated chloride channel family protein
MALSLVVDTSGSMEGEKIAHARMAAASLIESLRDGDIVSVYAFSNSVTEIASPTTVGAGTRNALIQRVNALVASGGTNLYDGVRVGQTRLAETPASHPVRRLVLISDGRANIGPSDAASLGVLAANGTEWGVQVSAIGVGLDYDEHLLAALAVQSSGRLYHLEHPAQMAVILQQELELLDQTIATNAVIEIVPAPGVRVLDVQSMGATIDNGLVRVPVGTLHAGQRREVLFRAQIDTERNGSREAATARLVFDEPSSGARRVQSASLAYEVVRDAAAAEESRAPAVVAMVANHEASQAQLRAAELMNQGRQAEAAQQIQLAADSIDGALRVAPAAPAAEQMRSRAARLRSSAGAAATAASPAEARSQSLEMQDAAMSEMGY